MKIIGKIAFPIFLAVTLVACNSVQSTPTSNSIDIAQTAIVIAETRIALTQTAMPTVISLPTIPMIPATATPPEPTRIPPDTLADKRDYAMKVAPTIYNHFPFISEALPYGEYAGCTQTYDFQNFVSYPVLQPMEIVNDAFLAYFETEHWEFREPISEISPSNNTSILRTTYDVFRISSKDQPSFQRLRITLTDETILRGEDYTQVRAEFTHVEAKENLRYLLDPFACLARQEAWQWIRLQK